MTANTKTSRYQKVQAILDKAHGTSTADYQGYGKFWKLPVDQLSNLVLYGIRMIAPLPPAIDCNQFGNNPAPANTPAQPAPVSSCCGGGNKTIGPPPPPANIPPSVPVKSSGRGAASGLIKGLKGEFPFDGSQFPPLMWGGERVSASDIQFISDWIDAGCPETDAAPVMKSLMSAAVTMGTEAHQVSKRSTNTIKAENGQLTQRKNAEFLSEDELCKFRYAIGEIKRLNAWPLDVRNFNNWAQVHGNQCQHGWEAFLPWHRMLLYEFEKGLQDIVPGVTLPYWDWVMPMYNEGKNPANMKGRYPKEIKVDKFPKEYISGILPTPYQCYLTKDGAERLVKQGVPGAIAALVGYRYNSGIEFFWGVEQLIGKDATASYKALITTELENTNPLWHVVRYPALFSVNGLLGEEAMQYRFHHHYPVQDDIDNILNVSSWRNFGGGAAFDESFGVLDMEPHNTMHIWTGGFNPFYIDSNKTPNEPAAGDTLNNLTTGYDPIFYGLHSNVDRIWALWQEKWPNQTAAEPDTYLAGFPYTIADSWNMRKLGYEYVAGSAYFETDKNAGIKMLKTGDTGINPKVLDIHQRATLKFHKVIPPVNSFGVRIFINQPDANENTPVKDNDHFAGYLSFFGHGNCIGGPGHCQMSPPRTGFDQRLRGHNREGNYRFDVTQTIRKLVKKGAKDVSIKLVTIGTDHLDAQDLLKMEGMSINFHQ